jgi:hypothetical protein
MFKRLLLGSVLGMTVVVFSSVAGMSANTTRLENRLRFDLRLLAALETRLTAIENNGGPLFLESFLERAITIEEKRIAKEECKLGHCGISAF